MSIAHFHSILKTPNQSHKLHLKATWFETQLGPMIAVADKKGLYLLEFFEKRDLENATKRLREKLNASIVEGENDITQQIQDEMCDYFSGIKNKFKTPIVLTGTSFQKNVWQALIHIPRGETRSYLEIAKAINSPKGFRAVAQANANNQLVIIVPCHRVINANGKLGGYSSGIARKEWLLTHENNTI